MKNILCFGDSNTWGYNPANKMRFPEGIRWTSLLQNRLGSKGINIIEEGLCGRTTIFEDATRPGRKGIDSLPDIFSKYSDVDYVILMLGTNDCKKYNNTTPKKIANGIEKCLDTITKYVSADNILLISPILLGEDVWKEEYDPEFDIHSVKVSKGLKEVYYQLSKKKGVHFLAASDYVQPSKVDQEHMNISGHRTFASVVSRYITDYIVNEVA